MTLQSKLDLVIFLKKAILLFLSIFLIGQYNEHITALKNFGLYTSMVLVLILCFVDFDWIKKNARFNIVNNKTLLVIFALLVLYILTISLFAYVEPLKTIADFFDDFKKTLLFMLLIIVCHDGNKEISKYLFYSMAVAICFDNIHFFIKAVEIYGFKNISIDRLYASFLDKTYAFLFLAVFFTSKTKVPFIIFVLNLFLCLFLVLLTGARGSWFSMFFTTIIMFYFLFKCYDFKNLIKYKKYIVSLFIFISAIFLIVVLNSDFVRSRFEKGLDGSGRLDILEKRLPLLYDSSRFFIGLGYGNKQYETFLVHKKLNNEYLGPAEIDKKTSTIKYLHDEPVFIGQFYHYGVIGTTLFLLLLFYVLIESIKRAKSNNVLYFAIFGSLISLYIFRGIFETISLEHLFLMISLFISFYIKEDKNA